MKKVAPGARTARRQYDASVNSPDAWSDVADNLLRAAILLMERSGSSNEPLSEPSLPVTPGPTQWQLPPVALMLKGMAAE